MPELTQEQIERLQNGEEVEVEVEVWYDPADPYPNTEVVILTMAEDEEE